jgi:sulfoxide reductase heme-binding subunit YedZ
VTPGRQPIDYAWWLVSRASGIVGLLLISLSVMMGLAMAARIIRAPQCRRTVASLHEQVAITALLAVVAHGLALLGDRWLKPGWSGITVPFAMSYRPQFTGAGIIAGYLALLLGPSFYLRRRIGARRWRKLHSAIAVVWLMSIVHTLGAGTDAAKPWLRALVIAPGVAIVYLLVLRVLRPRRRAARALPRRAASASAAPKRRQKPRSYSAPTDTPAVSSEVASTRTSGGVSSHKLRVVGISSTPT